MDNPLAQNLLPPFSRILPEHVEPAVERLLRDYRERIAALVAISAPGWENVMQVLEELDDGLSALWAPVSHLHHVMDSPALRVVYAKALDRITEHETEIGQNRALYEAVLQVSRNVDLTAVQCKIVDNALRDFRLSGVALEEPARGRFKALMNELAKAQNEFEQAVLDATDAWFLDVIEPSALKGLPESALALLKGNAAHAAAAGHRITLQHPSYVAIMTHAEDRALRKQVYEAHATRASDQGPHAGRFDNSERIAEILGHRLEAARLLGFANAAEESLATKMAENIDQVMAFLSGLVDKAKPVARRELEAMRAFAREELAIVDLSAWDMAYVAEKLRQRRFDLSEEEVKPYFPLPKVLQGLFDIVEMLFGVRFRPNSSIDVWHPDVQFFDVVDQGDQVIAGVYLDLYARQAKRGGAWMDVCRNRYRTGQGTQNPVAFLTCNFAPPTPERPALLNHQEVITLFHEFGHGLHHMLTEVDYPSVGGISGVEWDAVELPSQFMENFCWDRRGLALIAAHWQTGAPLPDNLFQRMLAAKNFNAALALLRQLEFAWFDFALHRDYAPGSDIQSVLQAARERVAVVEPPTWQRFAHGFSHIFAGGYAAGYYSYLWAEVLSADVFSKFEEHGVLDVATGQSFKSEILAVGGSRPAMQSFVAFRGRQPRIDALLKGHGLA